MSDLISNLDIVKDYSMSWYLRGGILKIRDFVNLAVVSWVALYFFGNLNMAEKLCAFIISGKVMGTDYVLQLRDVYIISAAIISTLLSISTYNYFKNERNRNKIKLRINQASPLSLTVRLA